MIIKKRDGYRIIINENIVKSPKSFEKMLLDEVKDKKDWGIIGLTCLDRDYKIINIGGYVAPNLYLPMSYANDERFVNQYPGTRKVELTGFFYALVNEDFIKKKKLPDDLMETQLHEADYCMECNKAGFEVYHCNKEFVIYLKEKAIDKNVNVKARLVEKESGKFAKKWKGYKQKQLKTPIAYQGRLTGTTGFARALSQYIKSLRDINIEAQYNYISGAPETEPKANDLYVTACMEQQADMNIPQIVWGQAPLFSKNSGKYKIGHCEFEGEEFPKSWIHWCNQMDEVWVPTKWDREKARKGGCNKPIHIIYQGIDPNYFHPEIEPMTMPVKKSFKFICNAAWLPRKNLGMLLKTFVATFSKSEDVCLILKTKNLGLIKSVKDEIDSLKIGDDSPWIVYKEEEWSDEEMSSFYTGGNCFVLPTHGEGWGLPIFEALACGIPVITTGYGAPFEVLWKGRKGSKKVPGIEFLDYRAVKARTPYEYLCDGKWAEPSAKQLREKMRDVFENYDKYKKEAMAGSVIIRKEFSWNVCAKQIQGRVKEIYKQGF